MYLQSGSSHCTADYHLQTTDTWHHSSGLTVTANLNTGAKVNIPVQSSQYPGTYAKTGEFLYLISRQALVNELAVLAQYGHNEFAVTPSVSFTGAPSLDFSWSIVVQATNNIYIPSM
jgi:hypothetical protein